MPRPRPSLAGLAAGLVLALAPLAAAPAWGGGAPFAGAPTGGDVGAQDARVRVDALMPARETRLEVVREEIAVVFTRRPGAPLAHVTTTQVIANPTAAAITVELGVPILRGAVARSRAASGPRPAFEVRVDGEPVPAAVVTTSEILGRVRRAARDVLGRALAADPTLARLVAALRAPKGPRATRPAQRTAARSALADYLVRKGWSERDAALMGEVAGLDLDQKTAAAPDRSRLLPLSELAQANLGPLAALGERRATQLLAHLAARFDPAAPRAERLAAAWAGDGRELVLDLGSGRLRPRERPRAGVGARGGPERGQPGDGAALDESVALTAAAKESLRRILRLEPAEPAVAPLNLLQVRLTVPPRSRRSVRITYTQVAHRSAAAPASYQVAAVVHPATLWRRSAPIHLAVTAFAGVPPRVSAPCPPALDGAGCRGAVATAPGEVVIALDAAALARTAPAPAAAPDRPTPGPVEAPPTP